MNALLTFWPEMAAQFLSAQAEAVAIGEKLAGEREPLKLRESAPFLPELLAPTERLPFNRPCSGPRKVAWTEIPMVEAKAIKAACGGTLNDFVLTLLTSAVRRYAKLHGVALKNRRLRVMVPVSLRREGDNGQLGNRVSMIPISIPLDVRDPVTLLRTIHRRSEWLKRGHIADFVKLVSTWMGVVPAPLQAAFGALAMPVPPFNMVCTNVPGPQAPMYLLGHRMLTSYPYVPIGNDMGLNCAVQSYNGTLYFGLTGDAVAVPDLARLNGFLQSSLLELRDATGISMLEKTAQPEAAPVPHSEAASFLGERLETSLPASPNYAPPPATNAAAKITAA